MAPASDAYFDSSVYGFIDDAGEGRAVRRWLNKSRLRVRASDDVNLGEALRIPDPEGRKSRIKTILTVAPVPTYPTDLRAAEELLREIRRCRPGWIRIYPSLQSKTAYLHERHAEIWDRLKHDPSFMPPTAHIVLPILQQVVGEDVAAQRGRRKAQLERARLEYKIHVPELAPIFASYGELEQYCRFRSEGEWRSLLTNAKTASAEVEWLQPHLDGPAMSEGNEWQEFWIKEVDLSAIPTTHIRALVEYFQAERPITAGNMFDRIHAGYLATYDLVVTADAHFYDALTLVKGHLSLRGSPVLIKRVAGASALAELDRVLTTWRGGRP